MAQLNKAQEVVLAILSELEESGIRALPLTSLVKFVYLVDYWHAKESAGATLTALKWCFLHFGPFDGAVVSAINGLEHVGWLNNQTGGGTSKDYQLFSLAASITRRTLQSVGLSARAATNVRQLLQQFGRDQAKLLNFVYYQTEPMENAAPGDLLEFTACRADKWQDIKPIAAKPIPSDALKAYRARVAARQAAEDAKARDPIVWQGMYDDVYDSAMALLNDTTGVQDNLGGRTAILGL
jgi:hypothetical protein